MNGRLLQLNDVGKRFGTQWALAHVTLSISSGEAIALFGGNGSGKSTLLKILATLSEPTWGEVLADGKKIGSDRINFRKDLAWLGHDKQLYDRLTVRENLELAAGLRGNILNPGIDSALERVGLKRFADYRIAELSEGLKKRVVLAKLLLGSPRLILLDEPHPTLDRDGRNLLDDLIREWRGQGRNIILASHDHSQALQHAARVIVLDRGRVHYDGPAMKEGQIPFPENSG